MIDNFKVSTKEDGTWFHFKASDGTQAMINVENMAEKFLAPGVKKTLRQWCVDQRTPEPIPAAKYAPSDFKIGDTPVEEFPGVTPAPKWPDEIWVMPELSILGRRWETYPYDNAERYIHAPLPFCEDEGCPQHGTKHVCVTPAPAVPSPIQPVLDRWDGHKNVHQIPAGDIRALIDFARTYAVLLRTVNDMGHFKCKIVDGVAHFEWPSTRDKVLAESEKDAALAFYGDYERYEKIHGTKAANEIMQSDKGRRAREALASVLVPR